MIGNARCPVSVVISRVCEVETDMLLSFPAVSRWALCWSSLDKTVRGWGGWWVWGRGEPDSHLFFNVRISWRLARSMRYKLCITNDSQSGSFLIRVISPSLPSGLRAAHSHGGSLPAFVGRSQISTFMNMEIIELSFVHFCVFTFSLFFCFNIV